jgi:hypothetical protein
MPESPEDREARYDEILRRIEARKSQPAPPEVGLAAILDGLNALGTLDELKRRAHPALNLYGPKSVRSTVLTADAGWVGAVLWGKQRGYYHYQQITLLGVWAVAGANGATTILAGTKALTFDHPLFNPEAYYHTIQQDFYLYYPDDGSPPTEPDTRLYQVVYTEGERLGIRTALATALKGWWKGAAGTGKADS